MASITSTSVVAVLVVSICLVVVSKDQQCTDYDLGPSYIPGHSCTDIYQQNKQAHKRSGYYWILDGNNITQQYCHMGQLEHCGDRSTWTKVANIIITNESNVEDCKKLTSFSTRPRMSFENQSTIYTCHIKATTNCTSIIFSTNKRNFTEICGHVDAYTIRGMDAFKNLTASVDDYYVDGISILTKSSPTKHVWTYAIGRSNTSRRGQNCPGKDPSAIEPPSFVGNSYYCDDNYKSLKADQPLWSSNHKCTHNETECVDDKPEQPWFHYKTKTTLNDDIVVKICSKITSKRKKIFIHQLELFIT